MSGQKRASCDPCGGVFHPVFFSPQHPQLAYYSYTDHSHAVAVMPGTQGRLQTQYAAIGTVRHVCCNVANRAKNNCFLNNFLW